MLEAHFKAKQDEIVLETPAYVEFVYANKGEHAIAFVIGNGRKDSYRFHTEPLTEILDPYYEHEDGSITQTTTVPPRATGNFEILLNSYLRITRPGRYILHCELDVDITNTVTKDKQPCEIRTHVPLHVRDDEVRRREVLDALQADVTGPDAEKSWRAADELAELRSSAALPVLARVLEVSSNPAVLEKMIIGLANTGGPEAIRLLRSFLEEAPLPELRQLAQQELARASG